MIEVTVGLTKIDHVKLRDILDLTKMFEGKNIKELVTNHLGQVMLSDYIKKRCEITHGRRIAPDTYTEIIKLSMVSRRCDTVAITGNPVMVSSMLDTMDVIQQELVNLYRIVEGKEYIGN